MILDCNDEDVDLLCIESVCTLQLEQHTTYRDYFMESARVRDFHTSW